MHKIRGKLYNFSYYPILAKKWVLYRIGAPKSLKYLHIIAKM